MSPLGPIIIANPLEVVFKKNYKTLCGPLYFM
jgi:hypothetical protein